MRVRLIGGTLWFDTSCAFVLRSIRGLREEKVKVAEQGEIRKKDKQEVSSERKEIHPEYLVII